VLSDIWSIHLRRADSSFPICSRNEAALRARVRLAKSQNDFPLAIDPDERTKRGKKVMFNQSAKEKGVLRRVLGTLWAFAETLESTGYDYTLDRIAGMERELVLLREELRQIRASGKSASSLYEETDRPTG
jgi:hypothetical protein